MDSAAPTDPRTGASRFWERKAAHHLLSGKVRCGVCEGPFRQHSGDFLRCANTSVGRCDNRASATRERLDAEVVEALATRMMEPRLAEVFAESFTAEWNRLAAEQGAEAEGLRARLAAMERKLANLVDAIADGPRGAGLQQKLDALEVERAEVQVRLTAPQTTVVRLMPNLGEAYRATLARLRERLAGPERDPEAFAIVRELIDVVIIHRGPPRKPPGLTVQGRLARMLTLAQPGVAPKAAEALVEVAGKEGQGV
jgi:hypothetical protein